MMSRSMSCVPMMYGCTEHKRSITHFFCVKNIFFNLCQEVRREEREERSVFKKDFACIDKNGKTCMMHMRDEVLVEVFMQSRNISAAQARTFKKFLFDSSVGLMSKVGVALAIGYLVVPVDLLPEVLLGPIGLLDDLGFGAVAAWYLRCAYKKYMKDAPALPLPDRPQR